MRFIRNYVTNLAGLAVGREPSRPLLFSYYVTHRCQLACSYCSDGEGKPFKSDPVAELDTGEARRLISILSQSADTLDVTGGEPMCREDLEELLAHAQASGMRTVLNTKGIGLPDRPDLLRFSDVLVLGVDSLARDQIERICGCPRQTATQILDALGFALAERGKARTQVVVSVVATPDNLSDAGALLDFADRHGLGFHISPEIQGVRVNPALRENADYDQLMRRVRNAKRKGGIVLGIPRYLDGISRFLPFRCHPLLMPVIRPDGCMAYPCLESPRARISILDSGSYDGALRAARAASGGIPRCDNQCQIFCHMALSLLQRHPLSALREGRFWSRIETECVRVDMTCEAESGRDR